MMGTGCLSGLGTNACQLPAMAAASSSHLALRNTMGHCEANILFLSLGKGEMNNGSQRTHFPTVSQNCHRAELVSLQGQV